MLCERKKTTVLSTESGSDLNVSTPFEPEQNVVIIVKNQFLWKLKNCNLVIDSFKIQNSNWFNNINNLLIVITENIVRHLTRSNELSI